MSNHVCQKNLKHMKSRAIENNNHPFFRIISENEILTNGQILKMKIRKLLIISCSFDFFGERGIDNIDFHWLLRLYI